VSVEGDFSTRQEFKVRRRNGCSLPAQGLGLGRENKPETGERSEHVPWHQSANLKNEPNTNPNQAAKPLILGVPPRKRSQTKPLSLLDLGMLRKRTQLIQSSSIAWFSDEQGWAALPLAPNTSLKKRHLRNRPGANPIGY